MPRLRSLSLATMLFLTGAAAFAQGPPLQHAPAQLSASAWRALHDQWREGRPLPQSIVERHQLEWRDEAEDWSPAASDALRPGAKAFRTSTVFLNPDVMANDRSGDFSCTGCSGRPLSQAETTIAAWGPYRVAGWNDTKGFCGFGAVQGYSVSTDGGATYVDQGEVPAFPGGGRFRGDPLHFADSGSGQFYIMGLHEQTLGTNLDVAMLSGHFSGTTWVIDWDRKIAAGGTNFFDKPWGTVDPVNHNLYVTYSNFVGGSTSQIEFIRSADGGTTWSAPTIMHDAAQNNLVQGSRPVVGPNGEVIVYWYESFTSFTSPFSKEHVRVSHDGGATFGPDVVATTFVENFTTGGAGYRRGFCPTFASIAVDRSADRHRGRIYLAWDEAVNFYDAPAPALGDKSETEQNGNFANATPFTVGQRLRGGLTSGTDSLDLWQFSGTRGQTVHFRTDSVTANANFQMRLQCSSDTTLFQNMRFLAFSLSASSNRIGYTLPYTGTYYLRMFRGGSGTANYRLLTSFDTPSAGERARDHRDQFVCWSDDGLAWSAPVRVVDSAPGNDGEFPEVAVDGAGRVSVYWHDWRDGGPCGAESAEYIVSSGDGGVTWGPNLRLSDANSFWSINACGSANQGDYQGIAVEGSSTIPAWADARNGDADVFTEELLRKTSHGCPSSPRLLAGGVVSTLTFSWTNAGNVSTDLAWQVDDGTGWVAPGTDPLSGHNVIAAGNGSSVTVNVTAPANCTPAKDTVLFVLQDLAVPGALDTCSVALDCGVLAVPAGMVPFAFAPPQPNPSRGYAVLSYTLPQDGRVRLAVFGVNGRRVRTLENGATLAGLHAVRWDHLDDDGRTVVPGTYYLRLESEGRALQRTLTVLR